MESTRLLALVVMVVAMTSVCGHLSGVVYLYHWGSNTAGMGINTAICLLLLSIVHLVRTK